MQQNYTENPEPVIEKAFNSIHQNEMSDMPFINSKLEVKAVDFSLYEGDWLGILLTPWTLSIMLVPGPDREWQSFQTGDKLGLRLPAGDYIFINGFHEEIGRYLSCSVQSPVNNIACQKDALRIAKDIRQLITAIPTTEITDPAKRNLFNKLASGQPALESEQ